MSCRRGCAALCAANPRATAAGPQQWCTPAAVPPAVAAAPRPPGVFCTCPRTPPPSLPNPCPSLPAPHAAAFGLSLFAKSSNQARTDLLVKGLPGLVVMLAGLVPTLGKYYPDEPADAFCASSGSGSGSGGAGGGSSNGGRGGVVAAAPGAPAPMAAVGSATK
jgi:hypothetical protein